MGRDDSTAEKNHLHDRIELAVDFRIREAKHIVARPAQVFTAREIPLSIGIEAVLRSIHFYDDAGTTTFEVDNVIQDRGLPPKMMSHCT